jgi:hypothetical protein
MGIALAVTEQNVSWDIVTILTDVVYNIFGTYSPYSLSNFRLITKDPNFTWRVDAVNEKHRIAQSQTLHTCRLAANDVEDPVYFVSMGFWKKPWECNIFLELTSYLSLRILILRAQPRQCARQRKDIEHTWQVQHYCYHPQNARLLKTRRRCVLCSARHQNTTARGHFSQKALPSHLG